MALVMATMSQKHSQGVPAPALALVMATMSQKHSYRIE